MAKFCTGCGATLADDKRFCTECGAAVSQAEAAVAAPEETVFAPPSAAPTPPPAQPAYQPPSQQAAPPPRPPAQPVGDPNAPPKGSKYEPITAGGYIGILLLMCIPVVGLLLTIIWACGGCRKVNKRSLARAALILMAVSLILGLIFGFVFRALIGSVVERSGAAETPSSGGLSALFGGESAQSENSGLGALGELGALLQGLEGIAGGQSGGLGDLLGNVEDINRDAQAANDGWPKTLRAYPGGTATAVASYRTEISGTTQEEMMGWIDQLKKDGFQYQDFYDFGMTEAEMLGANGWWAYDGKTYLSVSYYDGVVTVDHTKELPDLTSYFN